MHLNLLSLTSEPDPRALGFLSHDDQTYFPHRPEHLGGIWGLLLHPAEGGGRKNAENGARLARVLTCNSC